MRKNSPRKWLHAVIDFLPLILIPVFMIYSHRHDVVGNGEPVVNVDTTVNYEHEYQTNNVNSVNDLILSNVYYLDSLDLIIDDDSTTDYSFSLNIIGASSTNVYNVEIDEFYVEDYLNNINNYLYVSAELNNSTGYGSLYLSCSNNSCYVGLYDSDLTSSSSRFFDSCYFVITYGLEDFKQYVIDGYVSLPTSSDYLGNIINATVNSTYTIDYEDTTVDNVFMNSFTTTVDKYFNFDSALPFTSDVQSWLNNNLFGGNMPPLAVSIWHIIVYEFIVDILFVLYAFFMFLIDFTEHLLDGFFDKACKGGK